MTLTVEALLDRLRDAPAVDLLDAYDHPEYSDLWDYDGQGPRLYRTFSRALVSQGHPCLALRIARRGLRQEAFQNDAALHFAVALAYARGGNLLSAEQRLAGILDAAVGSAGAPASDMSPQLRVEIVALRGRLYKNQYQREKDPTRKRELANRSAEWYLRAAALPEADPFPLINAATMKRVSGQMEQARSLACQVRDRLRAALEPIPEPAHYWTHAMLGEAYLLLDEQDQALESYLTAAELALNQSAIGDLVSMLGNLRLLAEAGATAEPAWLRERLGNVIVFSGHLTDPPKRTEKGLPPRFPNDPALVNKVKAALRDRLQRLNARFGFCSLASGSDILFAEAMLERNAELHVVLPFARHDFLITSVDYGHAGDTRLQAWRSRFEGVLAQLKPDRLLYATTEPYLGTELLFAYANKYIQGMGVLRAEQCLVDPVALVVLDPGTEEAPGGTSHFLETWRKSGRRGDMIDLAALRGTVPAPRVARPRAAPPATAKHVEFKRVVRSMLFADVASFSQMNEELAPKFFAEFPCAVARALESAGKQALLTNTWGDGFFAVFEQVADCAAFALDLLDIAGHDVDWRGLGFPDANPLRIGLHAGPVFEFADDPILHRANFFGQHVNRAARIEPVTIAGCAFASEQFAALLTMEAPQAFRCEVIGVETLPKKSGLLALYRIRRS